jgi:hypothetical protein
MCQLTFVPSCARAVAELAVFAVPFNVMAFIPSFYFGGLTIWIGADILKVKGCMQQARVLAGVHLT